MWIALEIWEGLVKAPSWPGHPVDYAASAKKLEITAAEQSDE